LTVSALKNPIGHLGGGLCGRGGGGRAHLRGGRVPIGIGLDGGRLRGMIGIVGRSDRRLILGPHVTALNAQRAVSVDADKARVSIRVQK